MDLIVRIIDSFHTTQNKGLPLGNVTSQLFANIYLNKLDQFVKHELKVKYYLRYCDDFIILHNDRRWLEEQVPKIKDFLQNKLSLLLHPDKVSIKKYSQGIDFLGYVVLPHHIVLRTKTKRRMFKKLAEKRRLWQVGELTAESFNQSLQSYLGMLKHGNCFALKREIFINWSPTVI
ncbi:MAG: RNA-directed DNA polymerase [Candidatus Magasanikbacteria bacterium]|nr:RNA-directed DNA polymerase [Candidatus Magasanikbacteria bacterium]